MGVSSSANLHVCFDYIYSPNMHFFDFARSTSLPYLSELWTLQRSIPDTYLVLRALSGCSYREPGWHSVESWRRFHTVSAPEWTETEAPPEKPQGVRLPRSGQVLKWLRINNRSITSDTVVKLLTRRLLFFYFFLCLSLLKHSATGFEGVWQVPTASATTLRLHAEVAFSPVSDTSGCINTPSCCHVISKLDIYIIYQVPGLT